MIDFDEWYVTWQGWHDSDYMMNKKAFTDGQKSKQESIDHMREYLVTGMQIAPENSEYWLALRDCLNELDGIMSKEK